MPIRRRAALAVSVLAAVTLLAGCRTDVDVSVIVAPGGAGTVTVTVDLDAGAAHQLGDPAGLALGDMRSAGWKVTGPSRRGDGLRIVAVRSFGSSEQLSAVLEEVGGPNGVFRGTSLQLTNGFASSAARFRTRVVLTGELTEFSDPKLAALLGGFPLGRTADELAASGATGRSSGRLQVRVALPGGVDDSNGRVVAGAATWTFPLSGSATDSRLNATATDRRVLPLVLVGAGIVALVAAAAIGWWAAAGKGERI